MAMSLETLLPTYWRSPEYLNAWRLSFEAAGDRGLLLRKILPHIPKYLGALDFLESGADDSFVVLFTHDLDNEAARENEYRIISLLAETGALSFYGAEGAAGAFAIDPYRAFPSREVTRGVTEHMLKTFMLSPLECAAVTCTDPILLWGIEDQALYEEAMAKYRAEATDYWQIIDRRAPRLFENLLAKMAELSIRLGGACISDYNFWRGHEWLQQRKIGHAGVRAASQGISKWGRNDMALRGEPYDEQEARLWEILGGWKRPKGKHYA